METAATINPPGSDDLTERKRRNAILKVLIGPLGTAAVSSRDTWSWSAIMLELADGGFSDSDLEAELAASRNTLYKWKTGATAPREMTRRLLRKAILELVDQRLNDLRD